MNEYDKLLDFQNLYRAHKAARKGKQGNREVIEFEMNLAENLIGLQDALKSGTYRIQGYYSFMVHDPKDRMIHALHYRDRVVQHCLCDEVLAPNLERRLIYDNAACRIGKGTDFARERLTGFLRENYRKNGPGGYFLKCDIRKFFDNIDHEMLKGRLRRAFTDVALLRLMDGIIDSYHTLPGKGLPLGNQTSQWFAIYYLDGLDRLIKEKLGVHYYTRYMDDAVLVHHDREFLQACLAQMRGYLREELKLELNDKTQILPIHNGVEYIGFRFYVNGNGGVIRKLSHKTKTRYKHRLRQMKREYAMGEMGYDEIKQVLTSYRAHLKKGHCFHLQRWSQKDFILKRESIGATALGNR